MKRVDGLGNEGIGDTSSLSWLQDQSARVLFDVAIQPPMPQQFFGPTCRRGFFLERRWSECHFDMIFVGFLVLFLDAFLGGHGDYHAQFVFNICDQATLIHIRTNHGCPFG